jgi:hypothetical protein
MQSLLHLNKKDVPSIIKDCFPEYTGNKYRLIVSDRYSLSNFWDGGSRSYCKLCSLETGQQVLPVNETSNPFTEAAHLTLDIPENFVIVEHTISCGKDAGIFIYCGNKNATKLLPQAEEEVLTDFEKRYIKATRQYKAITRDTRREYARMTVDDWEASKQSLLQKGFVNRTGTLTIKGKNYNG